MGETVARREKDKERHQQLLSILFWALIIFCPFCVSFQIYFFKTDIVIYILEVRKQVQSN